uniref:PDZ domain-containing protein n=1 Tax=Panagrolaimus superbus TaxID=310955 RepID=A0A914Z4A4_9BILA
MQQQQSTPTNQPSSAAVAAGSGAGGGGMRRMSRNNRSRNNRSRNNRSRNNRSRSGLRGRDERGYQGIMPNGDVHEMPTGIPAPQQQHGSSLPIQEIPKTFFCQLAHGGPTAVIPTPNNLAEVYQAIASKFDGMSAEDILYCTVNTFKPDMNNLLTTNLKLNDFIFAHCHGTRKEVTLTKTDAMLGVTLTDNGFGKVFIKRIHSDSVAARSQPAVLVGDHIEKINEQLVVGTRHYNVASALRAIPVGESFTLRLVEPQKSEFSFIAPRKSGSTSSNASKKVENVQDGNQTLRFRAHGNVVLQEAPSQAVVDKINDIFETYLGFNDDVLALAGWEIASKAKNYVDLKNLFADSDLGGFGFPDELYFDVWGAVDDYRKKRLPSEEEAETTEKSSTLNDVATTKTKN